jgi:hypothetical protein
MNVREQTSYAVGLIFAVQADARSGMIGLMERGIDAGETVQTGY